MGRYLHDNRLTDDKQAIVRDGFNQPIDEKGRNLTLGTTTVLSNRLVNEARFGYVHRKRGLLATNPGVPKHRLRRRHDRVRQLRHQPGVVSPRRRSTGWTRCRCRSAATR